jgi:hypothetical protein
MKKGNYIMTTTFTNGVNDATNDLTNGLITDRLTLDFIVNELRVRLNCSDSYLAGYLSVIFSSK